MPRVVPSQVVDLIDRLFPQLTPGAKDRKQWVNLTIERCYSLQSLLDHLDQLPPELIVLDAGDYSIFASSVAAIRTVLKNPQAHGRSWKVELAPIDEFGGLSPIALVRDLLSKCPDEWPLPGMSELTFVSNKTLREGLRNDLGATNRALSNSEWKATTVLAGSVLEALLLQALQNQSSTTLTSAVNNTLARNNLLPKNLDPRSLEDRNWNLAAYIEVAAELKLIKEDTANQARLAKDFRNLIHPGAVIRLGKGCDRGTALSALAGVELVIRDLSGP